MMVLRGGMIAALLLGSTPEIATAEQPDTSPVLAAYLSKTSVAPRCRASSRRDEILVCSRREADRYRVPFVAPSAGDPSIQDVPAERAHLVARSSACAELKSILVGCGMVGVSTGVGRGANGKLRLRPIAP